MTAAPTSLSDRATWANWARNQVCAPTEVRRPRTEAELADLVKQAAAAGQRVKAVGAGHSFTSIACTDGVQVDLSGYGRVLGHDAATNRVTVESGIPLHRLSDELDARGLALENMGDIDRQTISGATQPPPTAPGSGSATCRPRSWACGWSPATARSSRRRRPTPGTRTPRCSRRPGPGWGRSGWCRR